jgi:hypothetical protein
MNGTVGHGKGIVSEVRGREECVDRERRMNGEIEEGRKQIASTDWGSMVEGGD